MTPPDVHTDTGPVPSGRRPVRQQVVDTRKGPTFLVLLPALLVLAACGEGAPGEDVGTLRPLEPPAAVGSSAPSLAVGPDGAVHLSWLEPVPAGEGHRLRFAVLGGGGTPVPGLGWSEAHTVAEGDDFFVNWADVPSVVPLPGGALAAHWLRRTGPETYAYGVRVAVSDDGGATWSDPVIPHADRSPTEHGFVSLYPDPDGGLGMAWLDGRDFAPPEGADRPMSPMEAEMSLRSARLDVRGVSPAAADGGATSGSADRGGRIASAGGPGEAAVVGRALVDGRVCDCCQTSVAVTDRGPLLVYRDRSAGEIRDIYASRRGPDGWSEPAPVHEDGWEIPACPVNGPSVDARGERAAVAWFTAARDTSRVRVAFSSDAGRRFGVPVRVDEGRPAGRVDVALAPDGSAVVSWLEVRDGEAEILLRRVTAAGEAGPAVTAATSSASRSAGFPRLALSGDRLVLAWTSPDEAGGVRAGWLPVADVPRP